MLSGEGQALVCSGTLPGVGGGDHMGWAGGDI